MKNFHYLIQQYESISNFKQIFEKWSASEKYTYKNFEIGTYIHKRISIIIKIRINKYKNVTVNLGFANAIWSSWKTYVSSSNPLYKGSRKTYNICTGRGRNILTVTFFKYSCTYRDIKHVDNRHADPDVDIHRSKIAKTSRSSHKQWWYVKYDVRHLKKIYNYKKIIKIEIFKHTTWAHLK